MTRLIAFLGWLGFAIRSYLSGLGRGARLFVRLVVLCRENMRRFSLVRDQIHFLGNYSLAIIAVSGLFVGFVLSLQGYYTLKRYGASEALGLLVALSLVRELGPVVSALLFAGRAGTSLTAEIGLMKAGEQLSAMDMMAVASTDVTNTSPLKMNASSFPLGETATSLPLPPLTGTTLSLFAFMSVVTVMGTFLALPSFFIR